MSERKEKKETILSRIWEEIPEQNNPFAASVCYCYGYDVYGDVLQQASWSEYLYLLFTGERPTENQSRLLESLAVALANPGPRDYSTRAAMNGGVGGSTSAASLMAALAVGAGQLGGSREIYRAVECWTQCKMDLNTWNKAFTQAIKGERTDIWMAMDHPPGFDPHGVSCPQPVRQVLEHLESLFGGDQHALTFLRNHREQLELAVRKPLAMSGVAAAALYDLGFDAEQAEMLYLLLRLPGAAVHSLEQKHNGWRKYPYFHHGVVLTDDPRLQTKNPL